MIARQGWRFNPSRCGRRARLGQRKSLLLRKQTSTALSSSSSSSFRAVSDRGDAASGVVGGQLRRLVGSICPNRRASDGPGRILAFKRRFRGDERGSVD